MVSGILLADPSKLTVATDWEPRIEFEAGIRDVCAPYV
jgi:nucleoside-diphosphate-sugar epimerase